LGSTPSCCGSKWSSSEARWCWHSSECST
jgi:hypothetical protein